MVLNLPLLFVSALFFLALVSAFYLGAHLLANTALRLGQSRLSHAARKRVLMTALVLPPLLALVPTVGGATLRHSHLSPAVEHHSMACEEMFTSLFSGPSPLGLTPAATQALGAAVNGLSWMLALVGGFLFLRLILATLQLERGLTPYLAPPSAKLAASLARAQRALPGLNPARFFECAIPAGYSSVLGLRRVRCVLSRTFVAEATDAELDAVVAHEASHMRARDVPATLLIGALNCFFFALRPVRLLARRWREEAELACDDAAVLATRAPLAMASAILRASGRPVTPSHLTHALPAAVMPFADEAACAPEKRIERLLLQAKSVALPVTTEPPAQVWGGWLVTLLLAGLGAAVLHSAQMVCFAHCSLEAVARLLP